MKNLLILVIIAISICIIAGCSYDNESFAGASVEKITLLENGNVRIEETIPEGTKTTDYYPEAENVKLLNLQTMLDNLQTRLDETQALIDEQIILVNKIKSAK